MTTPTMLSKDLKLGDQGLMPLTRRWSMPLIMRSGCFEDVRSFDRARS